MWNWAADAGEKQDFPKANGTALIQVHAGKQGERVYAEEGLSCTLTSGSGGMGGKTGLYEVGIPIKENTRKGYKMKTYFGMSQPVFMIILNVGLIFVFYRLTKNISKKHQVTG